MNLKRSPFAIQDKNSRDLDNAKDYSTLKELVEEQGFSTDLSDYWDKECELNPSDPRCLVYDDQFLLLFIKAYKSNKRQSFLDLSLRGHLEG